MNLPDPTCADCKGSGKILLLNRTVKCFCLDRKEEIIDDDPLDLNKMFNDKLKEHNDINWPII